MRLAFICFFNGYSMAKAQLKMSVLPKMGRVRPFPSRSSSWLLIFAMSLLPVGEQAHGEDQLLGLGVRPFLQMVFEDYRSALFPMD